MGIEQRRDRRYRVRLPVALMRGPKSYRLQTEDVSFRGAFLRTDDPPQLRQLVRIRLLLPPENQEFFGHAMVVHVVEPGTIAAEVRTPGAGIQFYGFSADERERWERFIHFVASREDAEGGQPQVFSQQTPDPVRRKHTRHPICLKIKLRTVDDLYTLYTRDVSRGGMFITTDLDLPVGEALTIDMVHPRTEQIFKLSCVVRRQVRRPEVNGAGVEFVGLDDALRARFFDFVTEDIPIDEDPVFVPLGDPKLA